MAVLGGGLVGAETAAFLAETGCDVSIVEMRAELALDAEPTPRKHLLGLLDAHGVCQVLYARAEKIDGGAVVVQRIGQEMRLGPFDAIVTAFGSKPRATLAVQLRALGANVSVVGDARTVRDAYSDIREGFEAGLAIG